jgi:chromosome segregation ATPase
MADNEIMKAYEVCKKLTECRSCGFYDTENCLDKHPEMITDLFNRKNAEIERLTNKLEQREEMMANLGVELTSMRGAANSYKMHYEKAQAEIERLQKESNLTYTFLKEAWKRIEELDKLNETVKTEAIKEIKLQLLQIAKELQGNLFGAPLIVKAIEEKLTEMDSELR